MLVNPIIENCQLSVASRHIPPMHLSLTTFLPALILPLLLFSITLTLRAQSSSDREKLSPFECGFEPSRSARLPFSTRFFLLAVIFLVFDIEIVILLPTPRLISSTTLPTLLYGLAPFLLVLIFGLLHE